MVSERIGLDGKIGSRIERRNSYLKICSGIKGVYVEKSYHARFTARQEYKAYQSLEALLLATPGIRLPQIYEIDDSYNTIQLELINGPNLVESFLQNGIQAFDQQRKVLVSLFVAAHTLDLPFDSDPSNFLIEPSTEGLVLVDPVSAEVNLPDFNIVVFLWGLIKSFIRSRAPHRFPVFWKCWKNYYIDYLKATDGKYWKLNNQISRYIDVVIGWNLSESQNDPWWKRIVRMIAIVPVWRAIQLPFKFNLVKG